MTPPCSLSVFTGIGRKLCTLNHKKELIFIARGLGLTQRFLLKKKFFYLDGEGKNFRFLLMLAVRGEAIRSTLYNVHERI